MSLCRLVEIALEARDAWEAAEASAGPDHEFTQAKKATALAGVAKAKEQSAAIASRLPSDILEVCGVDPYTAMEVLLLARDTALESAVLSRSGEEVESAVHQFYAAFQVLRVVLRRLPDPASPSPRPHWN